ncbi:Nse4 C-terminal-domain-containing protein [Flagelloscypha sp. PMI_526]|nr:Nse4 C-terminal-domain-containing protein [Flagelloscypha sp. PMI_526]
MPDVEMEMVYNPDQDLEERRRLRKSYRTLAKTAEDQRDNPDDYSASEITEQVKKADALFSKVRGPQEATLDSSFLLTASSMGAQRARNLKSGSTAFDVDEFIATLVTFMASSSEDRIPPEDGESDLADDVHLDWHRIGRKSLARSRRVPSMGFMLGPLSIEQKQKQQARRIKYEKNKEDMTRPQELKEDDIQKSENETSKNVAELAALLETTGSINLFKFTINPNDFAQSVENMFHLSFLIRDGKVAMQYEDGEPMIFLCGEPTEEDYANDLKKQQIIFEFDMATWRRAMEVFEIKTPIIPQRKQAKTKIAGQWYG